MNMLNAVGWHFHFISDDRQAGGHVMNLRGDKATIKWDYTQEFSMKLPDSEEFKDYDLTVEQSEDIKKVETGESK
jgi:acetolactate decarboxylase